MSCLRAWVVNETFGPFWYVWQHHRISPGFPSEANSLTAYVRQRRLARNDEVKRAHCLHALLVDWLSAATTESIPSIPRGSTRRRGEWRSLFRTEMRKRSLSWLACSLDGVSRRCRSPAYSHLNSFFVMARGSTARRLGRHITHARQLS